MITKLNIVDSGQGAYILYTHTQTPTHMNTQDALYCANEGYECTSTLMEILLRGLNGLRT